jgi:hypothetical protein
VVDSVFDLDAIREAHTRLESNATFGKVVLRIAVASGQLSAGD